MIFVDKFLVKLGGWHDTARTGGLADASPQQPRADHQAGAPLASAAVDGKSEERILLCHRLQLQAEGDDGR